jgi:hypothetical protein
VLPLVLSRKLQIGFRSLLRLLDDPVEQDHPLPSVDVEEDPCNPVARQVRPHFVKPVAQWTAGWHADRPAKLDGFDIFSDYAAGLPPPSL